MGIINININLPDTTEIAVHKSEGNPHCLLMKKLAGLEIPVIEVR
jgi:hypothetical protein